MKSRKPTRQQKKELFERYHKDPSEWLVKHWTPECTYITLVSRWTGKESVVMKK